ncbi:MAG: ribose-5-phosphate isomerase RpiA [Acidobacteria bacterium]|nr:ribose-5-phosphate isomerase RpiA [Acidobacteriota bacterium]
MNSYRHARADSDGEKQTAARAAVRLIRSGDVVGLGSGSTAAHVVRFLAERVRNEGLRVVGIPTSQQTRKLAEQLSIPLTTLDEIQQIDITLDGADEIDPDLNLIKGGGGALLREKIIASASRRLIIVADSSKTVPHLGEFPLPVEVIPFAQPLIQTRICALGARVCLRRDPDGTAYVTDEGHHILDCSFGEIREPGNLAAKLRAFPGVVEHGLFVGMAAMAVVGKDQEVIQLERAARFTRE